MKTIVAFIGPLPPPVGGVSMINQSFQQLDYQDIEIKAFNTSNNRTRENLYRRYPFENVLREFKKIYRLRFFLKLNNPKVANVFVTSGYSILRDCIYLLVLKCFHIPVIIHFHSKKQGEFALSQNKIKYLGRFLGHFADKIILLSQDHYSFFTGYFPEDKCFVIENFVDYRNFVCDIKDKRDEFIYVGRLTKEKGFFDLLEAVKILKAENIHVKINIIGVACTDEEELAIKQLISNSNIEEFLVFHGLKLGNEKYNLYRRCRFLIFPSHFENSPVVLKEAIASKMAIIASDIEPNLQILSGSNNFIMHRAGDPGSIAGAIRAILDLPDKGMSLCLASARIQKFDSSVARDKLVTLLNELLVTRGVSRKSFRTKNA